MPSGSGNFGSRMFPSSSETLQRSAISSVRRIASSWPGKSSAISAGDLKKNWSVSNFQWFGFLSESPDWMQSSASCAFASSWRR